MRGLVLAGLVWLTLSGTVLAARPKMTTDGAVETMRQLVKRSCPCPASATLEERRAQRRCVRQAIARVVKALERVGKESACAAPVAVCGNGVLEAPETCDDGNTRPCDGCARDRSGDDAAACTTVVGSYLGLPGALVECHPGSDPDAAVTTVTTTANRTFTLSGVPAESGPIVCLAVDSVPSPSSNIHIAQAGVSDLLEPVAGGTTAAGTILTQRTETPPVCSGANDWLVLSQGLPTPAAVMDDGPSRLVAYAAGHRLRVIDQIGSVLGQSIFASDLLAAPAPVLFDDSSALFTASLDGSLSRVDLVPGAGLASAGSRDLRRPGCAADALASSPVFTILPDGSGVIVVATADGCGDHAENRIVGLDPATLEPVWTFNESGDHAVDASFGGCTTTPGAGRVFCATLRPRAAQDTVWALDAATGSLLWSRDVGSVRSRPELANGRLYVVNEAGVVTALEAETGDDRWSLTVTGIVTGSAPVTQPLAVDANGFPGPRLYLTDAAGTLHAVQENAAGDAGGILWHQAGADELVSGVAYDSVGRKLYAGATNGRVVQIDPLTGVVEAARMVASSAVVTPVIDHGFEGSTGRLVTSGFTSTGTVTKEFCVPFAFASLGS